MHLPAGRQETQNFYAHYHFVPFILPPALGFWICHLVACAPRATTAARARPRAIFMHRILRAHPERGRVPCADPDGVLGNIFFNCGGERNISRAHDAPHPLADPCGMDETGEAIAHSRRSHHDNDWPYGSPRNCL